jgi:hypothetical protein
VVTIDEEYDEPGTEEYERPESELPDFDIIIGAPDLTSLIKKPLNAKGREYRDKAASGLRAVMVGSLQTGNFADAAAVLWHGPGAATAIGGLCAENEWAARAIDMVTTPSSPLATFLLTVMPLLSQLGRNHEEQLRELPSRWAMGKKARAERKQAKAQQPKSKPLFTLHLWRWRVPVRLNLSAPIRTFVGGVRSQTHEPTQLATRVFTDPGVITQLDKLGIQIINDKSSGNGERPV